MESKKKTERWRERVGIDGEWVSKRKEDGDKNKRKQISVPIKRDGERRGKDWRIRRRERRQNREKE